MKCCLNAVFRMCEHTSTAKQNSNKCSGNMMDHYVNTTNLIQLRRTNACIRGLKYYVHVICFDHLSVQNKLGDTPLHSASWKGHPEIVEMLLDKGNVFFL